MRSLRGSQMNSSNRPVTFFIALLFIAGAAVVMPAPDVRADVDIVPVVEVMNNTAIVELLVHGDIAHVNVTREYTLNESKGIDEIFDAGILAAGSRMTTARLGAPEWGSLNQAGYAFNITFTTSFEGNSRVRVRYTYSLEFQGVGALNFSLITKSSDEVHKMWTRMIMCISDLTFWIRSNIPVTAGDGAQEKTGTDLEFKYPYHAPRIYETYKPIQYHHLVCWDRSASTARADETINTRLTAERHAIMDSLIRSEFVNITIGPGSTRLSYFMHGEFNLNSSVMDKFSPVWLWFPNNVTSAEAWISSKPCELQESVRDGQRGFYILANNYYGIRPQLVVNITGNITDPWCDFFIVTVPAESSSIRYILPDTAQITGYGSPYEKADFENTSASRVVDFHGRCLGRGPVHIQWDPVFMYPCSLKVSLSDVTCAGAALAWETTSDPDFVRYEICRSDRRGEPGAICASIGDQAARKYTVTGLEPNTTYYLTVRKMITLNRGVDSEQIELQTPPDPPMRCKVNVVRLEEGSPIAIVTWTPSTSGDFTCYKVFRSSGKGVLGENITTIYDRSTVEYNMTRLDLNTSYFFTVMTITNRSGEACSDQVQLAPPKAAKSVTGVSIPGTSPSMVGISLLALVVLFFIVLIAPRKAK